MDGTFTVSSQSKAIALLSPVLLCNELCFLLLFYLTAVTLPEEMSLGFSILLYFLLLLAIQMHLII